jgi:hypothetical protein
MLNPDPSKRLTIDEFFKKKYVKQSINKIKRDKKISASKMSTTSSHESLQDDSDNTY